MRRSSRYVFTLFPSSFPPARPRFIHKCLPFSCPEPSQPLTDPSTPPSLPPSLLSRQVINGEKASIQLNDFVLPLPGRYLSFDINRQSYQHEGLDQVGREGGREGGTF